MNNPGIQFGMDGPVMSGTWVNPKTGHKFTVQDCFIEDNQFRVQTTTGQILDYNAIQDYVQSSNSSANTPSIQSSTPTQSAIPTEVQALIDDSQDDLILPEDRNMGLGNLNDPHRDETHRTKQVNYVQTKTDEEEADLTMIRRVLRRFPMPELDASIKWPEVPVKQITTLVDILGIDPSTIAAYYINQLDRDTVFNFFIQALSDYINKIGGIETTAATTDEIPETKTKTSRKTKKKL